MTSSCIQTRYVFVLSPHIAHIAHATMCCAPDPLSAQGPTLVEWIPDVQLHDPLPAKFVPRGRSYSSVVFEATSGLVVAASSAEARFGLFDEEGVKMWDPDGELSLKHACLG